MAEEKKELTQEELQIKEFKTKHIKMIEESDGKKSGYIFINISNFSPSDIEYFGICDADILKLRMEKLISALAKINLMQKISNMVQDPRDRDSLLQGLSSK